MQASTYTFRNIIEGGFVYVDKTRYLYELVRPGTGIYFLARPRRFGKSLTVSTLEEIFQGNKQLFTVLQIFFANVPYNIHLQHERYYQTIFYLIFKLIGLRISAEIYTNRGRIDAVIELANHIFLFEFTLDKSADMALKQIEDHHYATKYRLKGKPITWVGANFDRGTRTISEWKSKLDPQTKPVKARRKTGN